MEMPKTMFVIGTILLIVGAMRWRVAPICWGIALDLSGSFAADLLGAKRLVKRVLQHSAEGDRVVVCFFGKTPRIVVDTTIDSHRTLQQVLNLLDSAQPLSEQGTNISASIALLLEQLRQVTQPRLLVVATDGYEDPPSTPLKFPVLDRTKTQIVFLGWRNTRDTTLTSALINAGVPFVITSTNSDWYPVIRRNRRWQPVWWLILLGSLCILWGWQLGRFARLGDRFLVVTAEGFVHHLPWEVGRVVSIGSSLGDTVFIPSRSSKQVFVKLERFGFWLQEGSKQIFFPLWRKVRLNFGAQQVAIGVEFRRRGGETK